MGFSRQEYCSGLSCPLPDPGIEPRSPVLQGRFFTAKPLGKASKERGCPFLCIFTNSVIANCTFFHVSEYFYIGVQDAIAKHTILSENLKNIKFYYVKIEITMVKSI